MHRPCLEASGGPVLVVETHSVLASKVPLSQSHSQAGSRSPWSLLSAACAGQTLVLRLNILLGGPFETVLHPPPLLRAQCGNRCSWFLLSAHKPGKELLLCRPVRGNRIPPRVDHVNHRQLWLSRELFPMCPHTQSGVTRYLSFAIPVVPSSWSPGVTPGALQPLTG